jgi:SAM-dependent methyltransferase
MSGAATTPADMAARSRAVRKPKRKGGSAPPAAAQRRCDSLYYQSLHDTSVKYQRSNWLLDELPALCEIDAASIVEIGCGNGLFLAEAARHWADVTGVDWACSPVLEQVLAAEPRIRFVQQDIAAFDPQRRFDLLVSADFLEHLQPEALGATIARLHAASRLGYHKIACYDDGHSHVSIFDAATWLGLFRAAAPAAGYRIVKTSYRKARRRKCVVVISNLDSCS